MSKLIDVKVLTWDQGGDGRFRRGWAAGLVDPGEISFLEEFYDFHSSQNCCKLFMKNGQEHEVVGTRAQFLEEVGSGDGE